MVIVFQIILGFIIFFIINWIGKHSYSIGYISLSVFARIDEAPAFNYVIRVFTPIAYLFITASILYALGLDSYVDHFYMVSIYYIAIRLIFNLLTSRALLINWTRQFVYWASICFFSYFAYSKIIITKANLIPDWSNIATELWIIVLVFLYQIFNQIELSNDRTIQRKENYMVKMVSDFKRKYGVIVDDQIKNDQLKGLVYAILVIENFNRPKIVRIVEYLSFYLRRKQHTLGIMQVQTDKFISDSESVLLGIKRLLAVYNSSVESYLNGEKEDYFSEYSLKSELISSHNGGQQYYDDVTEMWEGIMGKFYPGTNDKLFPEKENNFSEVI